MKKCCIKCHPRNNLFLPSASLSAAEAAANLDSSDAAVGEAPDDSKGAATPTTTTTRVIASTNTEATLTADSAEAGGVRGEDETQMTAYKNRFYKQIDEDNASKKKKIQLPDRITYMRMLDTLKNWKKGDRHTKEELKWSATYKVMDNASPESSIWRECKVKKNTLEVKLAIKENIFDIIYTAHQLTGHRHGARELHANIQQKWYGITEADVVTCVRMCPICIGAQPSTKAKQKPLKWIFSETIGDRAVMDLIDMSSQRDPAGYCWILRLIDHNSGFGATAPLKTKKAEECSIAIAKILSSNVDFNILQSDNGGEFLGETVKLVNE